MKKLQALVLLFAFTVILFGGLTLTTSKRVEAAKCCWVMVCQTAPPYACWEVCRPCPRL